MFNVNHINFKVLFKRMAIRLQWTMLLSSDNSLLWSYNFVFLEMKGWRALFEEDWQISLSHIAPMVKNQNIGIVVIYVYIIDDRNSYFETIFMFMYFVGYNNNNDNNNRKLSEIILFCQKINRSEQLLGVLSIFLFLELFSH